MAEATGGEVLAQPSALAAALTRLRSRFELRYEAPRAVNGRAAAGGGAHLPLRRPGPVPAMGRRRHP